MNRAHRIAPFVLSAMFALGCQQKPDFQQFCAERVVRHDTSYGKLMLSLAGGNVSLKWDERIDSHHRLAGCDGAPIDLWVIKGKAEGLRPRGTVVILHGLLDSKASYLSLGERLAGMGYDVVLPDLRAHGASGGVYVTWGVKERMDVKAVLDRLIAGKIVCDRIFVFGSSLGGAVAIQYAAVDARVRGVVAMAPFKDITIVRRCMAVLCPGMSDQDFQAVLDRAGRIAGFNPADASTVAAAAKLRCPLLLVHGLLDMTVPVDHSQAIYAAAPLPKQLVIVSWASHSTLLLAREAWIAEQIDNLAATGLRKPCTQPAKDE